MIGMGGRSISAEISPVAILHTPQSTLWKTHGTTNLSWSREGVGFVKISLASSVLVSSLVRPVKTMLHHSSTCTTASSFLIAFPDNPSLTEHNSFVLFIRILGDLVSSPTSKWRNKYTENPWITLCNNKSLGILDCLPATTPRNEIPGSTDLRWIKMSEMKLIFTWIR